MDKCQCHGAPSVTDLSAIGPICERNAGKPGALITILQEVQAALGWLPVAALEEVSRRTGIPASKIYGVVTFYSQFRLEPTGRHTVRVCQGTACHVAGAKAVMAEALDHLGVEAGRTTPDGQFTIESVACLGCCSLAPAVMIDGAVFGRLDGRGLVALLDERAGTASCGRRPPGTPPDPASAGAEGSR